MIILKVVAQILEILISIPALLIGFVVQCWIDTFAGGGRLKKDMDDWIGI